jgi:hypothetical protein
MPYITAKPSNGVQEEDKRSVSEDFNPKQYEGLLPKEFLNLPTTVSEKLRCQVRILTLVAGTWAGKDVGGYPGGSGG